MEVQNNFINVSFADSSGWLLALQWKSARAADSRLPNLLLFDFVPGLTEFAQVHRHFQLLGGEIFSIHLDFGDNFLRLGRHIERSILVTPNESGNR
jgi:hypothetical protein